VSSEREVGLFRQGRFRVRKCVYCCLLKAAVLCQFLEEVDYTTAFKNLGDIKSSTCSDAMDSYYSCIWDTTILEYLVYLHTKRGEHHRKQQAVSIALSILFCMAE
jgi:integrator complex subunit 8